MTRDVPNNGLGERIATLRAERGDKVSIDEVAEVVASIMATMEGDVTPVDLKVYRELDDLAKYIRTAKSEIAALCPDDIRHEHLPAATDQLDAIVAATEEATSTILDATEKIDTLASNLGAQEITDQVIRIFEACGFQDITGQRISKVVTALKHIEEHLDQLVSVFGDEVRRSCAAAAQDTEQGTKSVIVDDKNLLNGPQMTGSGNNQEEIDALLAGFD